MLPRLLLRTRLLPDLTGGRVLVQVGVADHAVRPKASWTGSGWRGDSYGGFGGGRPLPTRITTAGNLKRPQEGDHAGFRPSRPSVWSRTGAFEATGTAGPNAGPRAAGS